MKLTMSDATCTSIREKLVSKSRAHGSYSSNWRSLTKGISAAVAGVCILLVGLSVGIRQLTDAHSASHSKYNYTKLLGFQPELPTSVPTGFSLVQLAAYTDVATSSGDIYLFNAQYNDPHSALDITEYRPTSADRGDGPWTPISVNGHTAYESTSDGYHVKIQQHGVEYEVGTNALSTISHVQIQQLLLGLDQPVVSPPHEFVQTFGNWDQGAAASQFKPMIPGYVPAGFQKSVFRIMGGSIKGKSLYSVRLEYLMHTSMITVSESRGDSTQSFINNTAPTVQKVSSYVTHGRTFLALGGGNSPVIPELVWYDPKRDLTISVSSPLSRTELAKIALSIQ